MASDSGLCNRQLPKARAHGLVSGATSPKAGIRDVRPTDKGPSGRTPKGVHMRTHTAVNLLPGGGFPAGTAKIQFFMCIPTVSTVDTASCLAHEQLDYNWRFLATESSKHLWTKVAK